MTAGPASSNGVVEHHRLRYDRVDIWGKVSFRRAGQMHHLETGEILSQHTIDPDKHYWRNTWWS